MANFGALENFLDDVDVTFEFRGKEYAETFPFKQVAAFKAHQTEFKERVRAGEVTPAEQAQNIYNATAVLFGGKFNPKTWQFTGLPKDHFINRLIADGASYTVIDRVVSGIWAKFEWNDDIAERFIETYDLGKALETVIAQAKAKNNDSQENPAGQTDTGETNEDDTETSED